MLCRGGGRVCVCGGGSAWRGCGFGRACAPRAPRVQGARSRRVAAHLAVRAPRAPDRAAAWQTLRRGALRAAAAGKQRALPPRVLRAAGSGRAAAAADRARARRPRAPRWARPSRGSRLSTCSPDACHGSPAGRVRWGARCHRPGWRPQPAAAIPTARGAEASPKRPGGVWGAAQGRGGGFGRCSGFGRGGANAIWLARSRACELARRAMRAPRRRAQAAALPRSAAARRPADAGPLLPLRPPRPTPPPGPPHAARVGRAVGRRRPHPEAPACACVHVPCVERIRQARPRLQRSPQCTTCARCTHVPRAVHAYVGSEERGHQPRCKGGGRSTGTTSFTRCLAGCRRATPRGPQTLGRLCAYAVPVCSLNCRVRGPIQPRRAKQGATCCSTGPSPSRCCAG